MRGSCPISGTPPLRPATKRWAPKTPDFENQWTLGIRYFFKGLADGLTHPRDQHKGSSLKSAQITCGKDSFANITGSARGARACWNSVWGTEVLVVIIFALLLYLDSTGGPCTHGSWHCAFLPLYESGQVCPGPALPMAPWKPGGDTQNKKM